MFGLKKRIKALENFLGVRYSESRYKDEDKEYMIEDGYGRMYDINKMLEKERKQEEQKRKATK